MSVIYALQRTSPAFCDSWKWLMGWSNALLFLPSGWLPQHSLLLPGLAWVQEEVYEESKPLIRSVLDGECEVPCCIDLPLPSSCAVIAQPPCPLAPLKPVPLCSPLQAITCASLHMARCVL